MPLFNSRRQGGSGAGKVTELHPAINKVKQVVKPVPVKQVDFKESSAKADAARQTFF